HPVWQRPASGESRGKRIPHSLDCVPSPDTAGRESRRDGPSGQLGQPIPTICFFAESEPRWVMGELEDEHAAHPPRYAGDGGRDPATDPGASAYVHFENGLRAFVSASKGTLGNFELDLVGERGRIRLGTHVAELIRPDGEERLVTASLHRPRTSRADAVAAVANLIDLVEGNGEELSTGQDARRVLSILLAILQSSAAGGQPVRFPIQDA